MVNRSRGAVQRRAQPAQLLGDRPPNSALPLPRDPFDEPVASRSRAGSTPAPAQQPFHHHLGCDAGVVGPRLPRGTSRPCIRRQRGISVSCTVNVSAAAHVQAAGDVRRRNHDRGDSGAALEFPDRRRTPLPLPALIKARFDLRGVVGLVQHLGLLRPHDDAAGGDDDNVRSGYDAAHGRARSRRAPALDHRRQIAFSHPSAADASLHARCPDGRSIAAGWREWPDPSG